MLRWLRHLSLRKRLELLAILLLMPFWFGFLWHGHVGNAVGAVVASAFFLLSFITAETRPYFKYTQLMAALAPGMVIWGIVSISPEYASYWAFPFMLYLYFQLDTGRAVIANLVFLGVLTWLLSLHMDSGTIARFLAGQLLANGFAMFFTCDRQANEKRLRQLATTDSLTGLFNRREAIRALKDAIEIKARYGQSSTILIIDLDLFKQVNDKYGHVKGDEVLIAFANLMKERVRSSDMLARLGGEEFLLLLSHTGIRQAQEVAEQLLKACRQHQFPIDESLTISVGIAECGEGYNLEFWLRSADNALYEAKQEGRDTYRCASTISSERQVA